jgi:hypothetical protein
MRTAATYDAKHLLQRLQLALASGQDQEVFRLTDALARVATRTAHNALLDVAACVAAEYAAGKHKKAESLVADGLYLTMAAESLIAA